MAAVAIPDKFSAAFKALRLPNDHAQSVEALKAGAFTPPALVGPVPFTYLQAMIGKAERR